MLYVLDEGQITNGAVLFPFLGGPPLLGQMKLE